VQNNFPKTIFEIIIINFGGSIKGLVHPKNENSVSIYSPSCCSKPLCEEDNWKNVLIKQISIPIDYHSQWGMRSV